MHAHHRSKLGFVFSGDFPFIQWLNMKFNGVEGNPQLTRNCFVGGTIFPS
jgi:hypothetical protein